MKLTPRLLLNAYSQGVFPMANENGSIYWFDPDPRAILPLEAFHIPRSLARKVKHHDFTVRVDSDFAAVIRACAEPAAGRQETWINPEVIAGYTQLHRLGFAHSVECWQDDHLVGGLYGVTVGGLFAGESMFSRQTDASKVALVYLVERLRQKGFCLLDVQFTTPHLLRFGVIEIPRSVYKQQLRHALIIPAQF